MTSRSARLACLATASLSPGVARPSVPWNRREHSDATSSPDTSLQGAKQEEGQEQGGQRREWRGVGIDSLGSLIQGRLHMKGRHSRMHLATHPE